MPVLAVLAAVLAAMPLLAPPTLAAAPVTQAADVLPSESAIRAMVSPMNVTAFEVLPPKDGWDARESFQLSGGSGLGPEVPVQTMISASELPTDEGAAGFLQTKLQQYRDATKAFGLDGQLGAADETLTMDADETYFGAFVTPEGASSRILTAVHVSRFENVVTAVEATMVWDSPGTIDQDSQRGLGVVLGLLARLVNEMAA